MVSSTTDLYLETIVKIYLPADGIVTVNIPAELFLSKLRSLIICNVLSAFSTKKLI